LVFVNFDILGSPIGPHKDDIVTTKTLNLTVVLKYIQHLDFELKKI
jgi:hypothetical protein